MITARTDFFGRYSVPGIPPQHYVLEVNLDNDGYSSDFYLREVGLPDRIAPRSAWVDAAGRGIAPELLVTRGRSVRVQLADSASSEPLTFAKPIVVAYRFRHENDWLRARAQRVIASPSGYFECRVPRHSGRLTIFPPTNTKRIWGGLLVPVEVTIPAEVTDQPVCARVQQAKAWRYVVGD
jgi:hypothetical protein